MPGPQLLTVAQACNRLHISRTTLYALLRRGELPSLKIPGARRIPESTVQAFVEGRLTHGGAA